MEESHYRNQVITEIAALMNREEEQAEEARQQAEEAQRASQEAGRASQGVGGHSSTTSRPPRSGNRRPLPSMMPPGPTYQEDIPLPPVAPERNESINYDLLIKNLQNIQERKQE